MVIDAAGHFVLPGLIDSHVRFRSPTPNGEDWRAGSRAAAAGGVTTVVDMSDPGALAGQAWPVEASLVDYLTPVAIEAGPLGRRASGTVVRLSGDPDAGARVFADAARHRVRLIAHPVDLPVLGLVREWLGPPKDFPDQEARWPRAAGIVATARLVELVRRHGTALHVQRVSSLDEADLLAAAAAAGLPVTFEVTGHHLSFTAADPLRVGARALLDPPARLATDQDRLWAAVISGDAATVASDHSPHRLAEKLRPPGEAPAGLPGVQELLPTLFTGLRRRWGLDAVGAAEVVVRCLADRPAGLFNLSDRKGRLAPGLDADLVVFDPDRSWLLDSSDIQSLCGWSAYEGWTFTGRVEVTMRRGEVVFDRRSGSVRFGTAGGRDLG
jgi:dihydroorotase